MQEFLATDAWDHEKLRDRLEQIVARDRADPQAIGIIDDSGHPKKGNKTGDRLRMAWTEESCQSLLSSLAGESRIPPP